MLLPIDSAELAGDWGVLVWMDYSSSMFSLMGMDYDEIGRHLKSTKFLL